MIEVRFLEKDEYQAAARLADSTFRDGEQKSMAAAYPQAFSPALNQSVGLFEDGILVSFIGVVPQIVNIGPAKIRVMSIGSVCTHPEVRGRGYAGRIFNFIQEHARKAGVSLLLVSGAGPLYARAGCAPFGSIHHIVMKREDMAQPTASNLQSVHFRRVQSSDLFNVHALSQAKSVVYEQSVWDWATLTDAGPTASNMKLEQQVWVAEQEGVLIGFAVAAVRGPVKAKGEPMIIEWSGESELMTSLMAHIMEVNQLDVLHWHVPSHEAANANLSSPSHAEKQLCTVCITDPSMLIGQLIPYLQTKKFPFPTLDHWSFEHGRAQLRFTDFLFDLSNQELQSVIFNPASEWPESIQHRSMLEAWFPIPFPYTGGLNYV